MKAISPYFYPTTITLVDDDPDMVLNLVRCLNLKSLPCKTFHDPRRALTFLNQDTYRVGFSNRLAISEEEGEGDSLTFAPRTLVSELTVLERFRQVSVLVVDYEMPGMRGLELCAQLHNPHIKKILLTGIVDENMAIEAFNTGIIHQYIRKHDPDFLTKLKKGIAKVQQDYFAELFHIPLEALKQRPESTALVDPVFIDFFQSLVRRYQIQEYYLMESTGSFLMIGADQKRYSLITLNDAHIESYLASESGEKMTPEELRALEARERIPCYYNPFKAPYLEPESITDFLQTPTILRGQHRTYYTAFGEGFIQVDEAAVFWKEECYLSG